MDVNRDEWWEKHSPSLSPVHKHSVGEGSDGEVGVGVLVQVHVARQRVAEHSDTGNCGQNLERDGDAFDLSPVKGKYSRVFKMPGGIDLLVQLDLRFS